ncbi:maleate cis-trans isomerase family protein [Rhodococcus sp. B50]|uniref:maleate cis-trans isomerase family protein n=1 Tax=Rhodococcus sp. B50 TaxID=2682847 RepID=UPI0019E69238|nr:aspartate/glutamate racemase family protein [Rhodococcus sp. B50]MBS9374044.1 Arylmalonate decarboxylase [Rhodococcus sp. B50]
MHRGRRPTVGVVYPDHAAEDDYPFAAELLGVTLPVVHIYGTDLHAVPELLDLGSPAKLAGGAAQFADERLDALVWACTSGSFVYGSEGARTQVEQLSRAAGGVPTTSTGVAFVAAIRSLGITRVAVAASYPRDVAELFVAFLADAGIDVVSLADAGIDTAAEVGALTEEAVLEFARNNDHPDAQAVLVPDTAMHTLRILRELEKETGKPVLTANQVTVWHGLELAGYTVGCPELGSLFEEDIDHGAR